MTSPYAPTLREPAHRVDPRAKTLWRIGPLLTGIPLTIAAIVLAALVEAARWPAVGAAAVTSVSVKSPSRWTGSAPALSLST